MSRRLSAAAGCALIAASLVTASAQSPQRPSGAPPAPSADPYATNAAPGTSTFPLAAPAGSDSRARDAAPAGATNTGPFNPGTWTFGTAFEAPAGTPVWNPVKLKMMAGGKVTGGTLFGATEPSIYCAMAQAGYDFIWTEMQHDHFCRVKKHG